MLRKSMESGGFENVKMEKVPAIVEVEDLNAWVLNMWSILGRMEAGWVDSDEKKWDEAVRAFGEEMSKQDGVEEMGNGRARLTGWCWVAIAQK